jgi:hypothetical protein
MNNVLEQYFAFTQEDKALDFIYEHLDTQLKAGQYELIDSYLRQILDNKEYWQRGIELPIFSLSFAIYTHHEPKKFQYREEFMKRLHTDYVSKHGEIRAANLLRGLIKDLK